MVIFCRTIKAYYISFLLKCFFLHALFVCLAECPCLIVFLFLLLILSCYHHLHIFLFCKRDMWSISAGLETVCQAKQKDSSSNNGVVLMCDKLGSYTRVQCMEGSPYCWCVDRYGKEVPRTRAKNIPRCNGQGKRLN